MKVRIRNETDFWSGVMFIAFGLFFGAFATRYNFGTAQVMGPAYFPTVLGGLLALVGVLVALAGLGRAGEGGKLERFHFAELAWVLGAVVIYAAILRWAGLLASMLALIVISSFASHEFCWKEAIILSIVMAVITYLVFIIGLKLTIPVLPAFLRS
jgi:hypothetical protein